MQSLILLLTVSLLTISQVSGAGPSISGGPSEAPWVESHDVFQQVLKTLEEKELAVSAIVLAKGGQTAKATVECGNGQNVLVIFSIEQTCHPTAVVCLPERIVTLDESRSEKCF